MNSFKKEEAVKEEETPKVEKKATDEGEHFVGKMLSKVNIMGYVSKGLMVNLMPYLFFLMVFALLYIGNSYHSEKMIRAIDKTGKEIKELRSEYIASKSELMQKSKQSAVAGQIEKYGIKESTVPPQKIVLVSKIQN